MTKIVENKLNNVTGGTTYETALDSWDLKQNGYMDRDFGDAQMWFHWIKYSAMVDEGWKKFGITSVTCPFTSNRYYKNGQEISRDMARYMLYHGKIY